MRFHHLFNLTALALAAWQACATDTLIVPCCDMSHRAVGKRPVPEGLGVNIHFYKGNDNDLRMLSEADVGIIRMDVSWAGACALLLDADGKTIAQTEPMTYQLVDPMAAPDGAIFGDRYRLWHEGDADRRIALNGALAAAPGENPPFQNAARIDYDIKPGWCFWQLGPKEQREMPHGEPKRIMLWVYGDESGDHMRCRVADSTGQTFQTGAGAIDFSGWQLVEMPLDGPMGSWGGADDGLIHPPLRWISYYLQDPARVASMGTTYVTGVVVAW